MFEFLSLSKQFLHDQQAEQQTRGMLAGTSSSIFAPFFRSCSTAATLPLLAALISTENQSRKNSKLLYPTKTLSLFLSHYLCSPLCPDLSWHGFIIIIHFSSSIFYLSTITIHHSNIRLSLSLFLSYYFSLFFFNFCPIFISVSTCLPGSIPVLK